MLDYTECKQTSVNDVYGWQGHSCEVQVLTLRFDKSMEIRMTMLYALIVQVHCTMYVPQWSKWI